MVFKLLFICFGILLVWWGIHRMKKDDAFFGKTKKRKIFFNFLLNGESSGLGQFLGGCLCIIIGIVSLFIK